MSTARIPRVLSIAGTDPTGGAGIQADLKSIAANGGYGMTVVTALVAQNTRGVRSVHMPPAAFIAEQLDAVSDDVAIDAVKIGMLGTAEVIEVVERWLAREAPPVVVLDPVMVATSGDRLLDVDAEDALRRLVSRAHLVTPNLAELAILAGDPGAGPVPVAGDWESALAQARAVAARAGTAVLAKGGHLDGDEAPDALVSATTTATATATARFPGTRIRTTSTHGTGCSLSSALATRRAAGLEWPEAVAEAKRWLTESIRHGAELEVGGGHGPINHFAGLWRRGGLTTAPTAEEAVADWWAGIHDLRDAIDDTPFVRELGDGTLDPAAFRWYLAQDARYLRDYSRALAEASRLAPTAAEQVFWARSADGALSAELQLHESWVDPAVVDATPPGPATTAYLDHLAAAASRGGYPTLVAALLPCFWLYRDVGERLAPRAHAAHPYRSWLETYADEEFAAATDRAIAIVGATAAGADAATRERMRVAFRASSEHELAFFRAPLA